MGIIQALYKHLRALISALDTRLSISKRFRWFLEHLSFSTLKSALKQIEIPAIVQQFMKFGIVGVIAFLIDFCLMVFFVEVFGMDHIVATTLSYVLSTIFNYFASMRYVFSHRKDISRRREFNIFLVLSIIGLIFNELIMFMGEHLLKSAGINYDDGRYYMLIKVLATLLVTLWNFYSRHRWIDGAAREARVVYKRTSTHKDL